MKREELYYKNKVAFITGGGSGIGKELSLELGKRGTTVIISDILLENAQAVAEEINSNNGNAHAFYLDVRLENEFQDIIESIFNKFARLDFIFNNAGISIAGEIRDLEIRHFKEIIDTNLNGVIYGSSFAYKKMLKQGYGHIINVSSIAGIVKGGVTQAPYGLTKNAVVTFSESLRDEAKDFGINVSIVCPACVESNIWSSARVVLENGEEKNTNTEDLKKLPMFPVDKAVKIILKGVSKKKAKIIFPFSQAFIILYMPFLMRIAVKKMLKNYRANRTDKKGQLMV